MKIKLRSKLVISLLLFGLLVGVGAAAIPQPGEKAVAYTGKGAPEKSQISIDKVPIDIYRRAANLLEELRVDEWEPNWKMGRLSSSVRLFFRPDKEGVSYYEFVVEPSGFIILSADQDDVPIPHYSSTGRSIGDILVERAKKAGKSAAKFYKLDSLSYVAEDATGALASNLGEMPLKISGIDPAWIKEGVQPGVAEVDSLAESDDKIKNVSRKVSRSGPEEYPIQQKKWQSWQELKQGYASTYRVFLDAQRNDAAEDWNVEKLLKESGEGLFPGDSIILAFLFPDATFDISGPGKDYISSKVLKREGLSDALEIQALKAPPGGRAEFKVAIKYGNGAREEIKFAVLDPSTVKYQNADDDKSQAGIGTKGNASDDQRLRIQIRWRPWETYWAGTDDDQRMYYQFDYGGCAVGCGPVAWGMLFGWADHQSWIGNPDWDRGGIYREDGGYGDDVDAPRNMDEGVRNMIREINDRVDTWCTDGSGATNPWDMDGAFGYLDDRSGAGARVDWSLIPTRSLRNRARDYVRDGDTPAIIGTGVLEHYPLAYGYRYRESRGGWFHQREFYVNQGWGGDGNGWIDARTWFAATVFN